MASVQFVRSAVVVARVVGGRRWKGRARNRNAATGRREETHLGGPSARVFGVVVDGYWFGVEARGSAEAARMSLNPATWLYGCLRRMALAFSRCKIMPKRCRIFMATSSSRSPVIEDCSLASSWKILCAWGPHPPPSASAIMGMNEMPSSRHWRSVSWYSLLKSSYARTVTPGSMAARLAMSSRSPLVTARSKAAGRPCRHLGT